MDKAKRDRLFGTVTKPKKIVDRSYAEGYGTCPLQAFLSKKYDLDRQIDQEPLVTIGEEGHSLVKEAWDWAQGDRGAFVDYVENEMTKARPDIQPQILRHIRYLAKEIASMSGEIMDVEQQIEAELDGYTCTAALDVLAAGNNSLIVTDWKMGFKKRSNQETFDSFQTQFDTWILWQQYPDIDLVHWFYKETRWGTTAYARLERNADSPQMPELTQEKAFEGRIRSTLRLIAEDSRVAWPEPKKCSWCPAVLFCSQANASAKRMRCNPRKFVDEMVVLDARLDRMREIAKFFYQQYGPMRGTKSSFDWRPTGPKFMPKLYPNGKGD